MNWCNKPPLSLDSSNTTPFFLENPTTAAQPLSPMILLERTLSLFYNFYHNLFLPRNYYRNLCLPHNFYGHFPYWSYFHGHFITVSFSNEIPTLPHNYQGCLKPPASDRSSQPKTFCPKPSALGAQSHVGVLSQSNSKLSKTDQKV